MMMFDFEDLDVAYQKRSLIFAASFQNSQLGVVHSRLTLNRYAKLPNDR